MANINHQFEGTRFATDVQIYDPTDGEILASLSDVSGMTSAEHVDNATDGTDVVTQLNALLASLRAAGILEETTSP